MEALCQWFYVKNMLLYTHTCPVTEFAVASHLNTANSCCHHVFLRHFRFQKCLPVYSNPIFPIRNHSNVITSEDNPACSRMSRCSSFKSDARRI